MLERLKALRRSDFIATAALFVALGSSAYAAISLPKDSVGTRQIRNNAVTGGKVRARTLGLDALKVSAANDLRGIDPRRIEVVDETRPPSPCGSTCSNPPGSTTDVEARCPAGMRVISGGYRLYDPQNATQMGVYSMAPSSDQKGWRVTFVLTTATPGSPGGTAIAVCA